MGDLVLREVGKRLQQCTLQSDRTRPYDAVGRLGGDQFAVCLADLPDSAALAAHAGNLLRALSQPYNVSGHTLFLTASIGGSAYPEQADSVHALLLNAESALHHAKPDGPGTYVYFDAAMNRRVARSLLIHNELHRALENVVRNALRHSPDGGTVRITSQPEIRPGWLEIRVDDEGPGVPPTELEAIFAPFMRSAGAQAHAGYGLGLAITSRVMSLHGGRASAENRAGGGLSVRLTLPAG